MSEANLPDGSQVQPGPGELRAAEAVREFVTDNPVLCPIDMLAAIIARQTGCAKMYEALQALQWRGRSWGSPNGICPSCAALEMNGHASDCNLAAAMAAYDKSTQVSAEKSR